MSTVQAGGGGVMVWGMFLWKTLGSLIPIEQHLHAQIIQAVLEAKGDT